jgi:hypothetical protein
LFGQILERRLRIINKKIISFWREYIVVFELDFVQKISAIASKKSCVVQYVARKRLQTLKEKSR